MFSIPNIPNKKSVKSVAVLTSGGDAPGMNAAIRAVVRTALSQGCRAYGIPKGFSGLIDGHFQEMNASSVANIIQRGGTILKTDRCEAFKKKSVRLEAAHLLKRNGIDALVVIGGDGSFTGAHLLEVETGIRTVGVPGTIDNDIFGSEDTIGFDTAVNTAVEAIDRIRDTASSHDRIFLVEVMGRSSGFIATSTGIGGGAETIVVPEAKQSIAQICRTIDRGAKRGKSSSIIVVAEGEPAGRTQRIAQELRDCGYSSKVCILGHTQRGGSPTAHDRVLASAMGATAVRALLGGKSDVMVGVRDGVIALMPFTKMFGKKKPVSRAQLELGAVLAT